jgi:hypothetical protein
MIWILALSRSYAIDASSSLVQDLKLITWLVAAFVFVSPSLVRDPYGTSLHT